MSYIGRFGTVYEDDDNDASVVVVTSSDSTKAANQRKRKAIDIDEIEVDYSYSDDEDNNDNGSVKRQSEQSFAQRIADDDKSTGKRARTITAEEKVFKRSAEIRKQQINRSTDYKPIARGQHAATHTVHTAPQHFKPAAGSAENRSEEHVVVAVGGRQVNLATIARMLASVRRNCIRFSRERNCFVYKDRSVPSLGGNTTEGETTLIGLRDILRRVCFPNYTYGDSDTPAFSTQRVSTGLMYANQGSMRGRDVHEQVATYISKGGAFWRAEYNFGCSPYVERIISALESRKLFPIASEFQDYFNNVRIGSAIDILCEDRENNGVAIVELKIGGENYFEKASGSLVAPRSLTNMSNSPRNQALLQLLAYRAMITTNYPYVRVTRCYVLQARTDCIMMYGLTKEFVSAQDELVAALVSRRNYEISQRRGSAVRGGRQWRGRGRGRRTATQYQP